LKHHGFGMYKESIDNAKCGCKNGATCQDTRIARR
jgi:hypothetical protein